MIQLYPFSQGRGLLGDLGLSVVGKSSKVSSNPGCTALLKQDGCLSDQTVRESWTRVATLMFFPKFGQNLIKSKLKISGSELLLGLGFYFQGWTCAFKASLILDF